jgi:hypothetical protein
MRLMGRSVAWIQAGRSRLVHLQPPTSAFLSFLYRNCTVFSFSCLVLLHSSSSFHSTLLLIPPRLSARSHGPACSRRLCSTPSCSAPGQVYQEFSVVGNRNFVRIIVFSGSGGRGGNMNGRCCHRTTTTRAFQIVVFSIVVAKRASLRICRCETDAERQKQTQTDQQVGSSHHHHRGEFLFDVEIYRRK